MNKIAHSMLFAATVLGGIAIGMLLSFRVALADEMKMLSVDEMQSQIIGNSLSGKTETGDAYVEHYEADGAVLGKSAASAYQGKWSLRQDGLMCFRYGDGAFDGG